MVTKTATENSMKRVESINNIHINNFDLIRFMAAVTVIYGHAFPLTNTASLTVLHNSIQALSVKIFFVISGYLISLSWLTDGNFKNYIIKRVLRIFPGLIVVVLVSAVIFGPVFTVLPLKEYFSNESFVFYFRNILLYPVYNLPGVFEYLPYRIAVNGSLWSLPVEFFMYLFIPIMLARYSRVVQKIVIIVAAVLICGISLVCLRSQFFDLPRIVIYGSSLRSALDVWPYFVIGSIYATLHLEKFLSLEVSLALVGCLSLLQPVSDFACELSLYFVLPYAVLSFAMAGKQLFYIFGKYGDFSYGLYLYGFPVEQIYNQIFHGSLTATDNALLSLPTALILAVFSWYLVERPCLNFKRFLH